MRRFVNFRLPVFFAFALALGILAGYLLSFNNSDIVYIIAVVPVAAIFFIVFTFICKPAYLVHLIIILVLFICGSVSTFVRLENFKYEDTDAQITYEVVGTVAEKGASSYGEYIVLKNATADGQNLSGNIIVYLIGNYGDYCDVGYTVNFSSALSANSLFPYGKLYYLAEDNVKYSCNLYSGLNAEYGFELFGTIRSHIKNTLYENMDSDTAAVCYAMLIGDTTNIDDESLTSFRYGGIAHIFAVSGLHIGLSFGIISFLMKRTRANKYICFAVSMGFIIFYAAVCGFTLSSVRAVIMCGVSALTRLAHLKRDGLNSLSFAVIIILLITPLSLFALGFQLSVSAVGGIFIFSNLIKRLFAKIKTPKKLVDAAGVSLSAQLGTLPAMMSGFGYVSGAGLILNIIIVPLISTLFVLLFICTLLSAIVPPIGVILSYAVLPLQGILSFLVAAGFENALIRTGTEVVAGVFLVCVIALSDKFNLKLIPRATLAVLFAVVTAMIITAQALSPAGGHKICVSAFSGGGCVIVKSRQGSVLILTEGSYSTGVFTSLSENYVLSLSGVIILGGENCAAAYDTAIGCGNVYISGLYLPVQPYGNAEVHYENDFELGGVSFTFYDGYSVYFECDGVSVGVTAGKEIPFKSCDLLISKYLNYDFSTADYLCDAQNTVYFAQKGYSYNIYEYGGMVFNTKAGKLTFFEPVRH